MAESDRHKEYRARKRAEVEALKAAAKPAVVTEMICVESIFVDPTVQLRAAMREEVIAEYADALQEGSKFPPAVVFRDGTGCWLSDGFHRHAAHQRLEFREIECDVRDGGRREAILYAAGANAAHGLRRTNADKRRAVEAVLADREWIKWTDTRIAQACGVSAVTVGRIREDCMSTMLTSVQPEVRQRSDGSTYTVPAKVTKNVTTIPEPSGEEQDWDAPDSPFRVEEEGEHLGNEEDVPDGLHGLLGVDFVEATGRPLSRLEVGDRALRDQVLHHPREGFPGLESLRNRLASHTHLDAVQVASVLRVVSAWLLEAAEKPQ